MAPDIAKLLLLIPVIAALGVLLVAVVRWLWNITLPQIGPFRTITFWQAFRIVLLVSVLGAVVRR